MLLFMRNLCDMGFLSRFLSWVGRRGGRKFDGFRTYLILGNGGII